MKKLLVITSLAIATLSLSACGVYNSANIDFDTADIAYAQDPRTGLCFAYTASRKAASFATNGLGLTNVPCTDKVLSQIKKQ